MGILPTVVEIGASGVYSCKYPLAALLKAAHGVVSILRVGEPQAV